MWITGDMLMKAMTRVPKQPVLAHDPLDFAVPTIPPLPELDEDTRSRPVIAIDVDGVLNVLGTPGPCAREVDTVIPAWATAKARYLNGHGEMNLPGGITVDPEHGVWLRSLIDRGCDLVWCTTWETAAPVVLGPLLGLPVLPVVALDAPAGMRDGSVDVKGQMLLKAFAGRPLVWLDDHNEHYRDGAFRPAYWPTLVPHIDGFTGLTAQVREEVDKWLDTNPVCGPQSVDQLNMRLLPTGEERFCPVGVKIRTGDGVLTLRGYDRNTGSWLARPSSKLRSALDLGTSEWISSVESPGKWDRVEVGAALSFVVHSTKKDYRDVSTTTQITTIEVLSEVPTRDGRQKYQNLPDLACAKDLQAQAAEIGARYGLENVAFKQGKGIYCWAGDTPLELVLSETNEHYVSVRVNVITGETSNGVPTYGWKRLYLGTRDGLGSNQVAPQHPLYPLNPVPAMELLGRVWQDFLRERDCVHVEEDAYCRNCGKQRVDPLVSTKDVD